MLSLTSLTHTSLYVVIIIKSKLITILNHFKLMILQTCNSSKMLSQKRKNSSNKVLPNVQHLQHGRFYQNVQKQSLFAFNRRFYRLCARVCCEIKLELDILFIFHLHGSTFLSDLFIHSCSYIITKHPTQRVLLIAQNI